MVDKNVLRHLLWVDWWIIRDIFYPRPFCGGVVLHLGGPLLIDRVGLKSGVTIFRTVSASNARLRLTGRGNRAG